MNGKGTVMIDLISDTVTMPDEEMLKAILSSPLGDAGRIGEDGRGEDLTTNRLEDMAAAVTGKEAALFFPSGTMANTAAVLSFCRQGDRVLVDEKQHLLRSEKICFEPDYFRMIPVCCRLDPAGGPDLEELERLLRDQKIRLLCLENTHNSAGGKCVSLEKMRKIRELADADGIPVHLDGARLFHAAEALGVSAAEICRYADTVMFCISKGLGAPIGSLLCGSRKTIEKAAQVRKLLGGTMRQSGVAAACGIYALEHNVDRLAEDRENARMAAGKLKELKKLTADPAPETNILLLGTERAGIDGKDLCRRLQRHGVRGLAVSDREVRLVFHKGITKEDAIRAAEAVLETDRELI